MSFKEKWGIYWGSKSRKQRICLFIIAALAILFFVFFIKGNVFDVPSDQSEKAVLSLDLGNIIDIIILVGLTAGYFIIKKSKKGRK